MAERGNSEFINTPTCEPLTGLTFTPQNDLSSPYSPPREKEMSFGVEVQKDLKH